MNKLLIVLFFLLPYSIVPMSAPSTSPLAKRTNFPSPAVVSKKSSFDFHKALIKEPTFTSIPFNTDLSTIEDLGGNTLIHALAKDFLSYQPKDKQKQFLSILKKLYECNVSIFKKNKKKQSPEDIIYSKRKNYATNKNKSVSKCKAVKDRVMIHSKFVLRAFATLRACNSLCLICKDSFNQNKPLIRQFCNCCLQAICEECYQDAQKATKKPQKLETVQALQISDEPEVQLNEDQLQMLTYEVQQDSFEEEEEKQKPYNLSICMHCRHKHATYRKVDMSWFYESTPS